MLAIAAATTLASNLLTGCFLQAQLPAPVVKTYDSSIHNYTYFYVTPTSDYTSSTGVTTDSDGKVSGGGMQTTNPADVISGILIKHGFVRVNDINPENASKTMVVNFGESGDIQRDFQPVSTEVSIQFVAADTQRLICTSSAEGAGSTLSERIRQAIVRALSPLFAGN